MALESSIAESLAQAYGSGDIDEVNRLLQENQVTSGDVQSYWNFSPEQAASSGLSFYQPQATQTEAAQPPPVTDVNSFFAAGTQNQPAASSAPGALTTATSGASALPGVTGQDTTGQTGQPRFTDEQYASAGQFINQNLNNPAAIISAIDELNLTSEDVLRAARTVNPNITYDQIIGYLDAAPTGATTGALTAATNNIVLTDPTSGQGLSIPREDYEGMRALLQVAMGEQTPGYQVTDADIAQWVSRGGVNAILDAFPVFNTATGTAGAASSAGTSAPLSNLNTVLTGPDATFSSVRSAYDAALADPNLTAEQRAQLEQIGTSLTEAESRWGSLGVDPLQAENLYRQINAINSATGGSNWSGSWMSGGENAAKEAAIRLNRLGVDSLADLRVVPDYADATTVEFYRGQQVRRDESGNRYIFESRSAGDNEQLYPVYLPPDAKVEYYSATTRNVIDPSESYSETSYAPLTEEELKTFDPETKTYKVRTFDKLIDASTGQKIANMSMGPAGPAFYIDQYETGNFLKGATKSFGIQIASDGTPIPFTTTEKEGLVYSPILPFIASILMPGVGQALTSTISSALPGAAVAASGATSAIAATTFNTIVSNALSNAIISGVTSELADGDFWEGFRSGLISTTVGAGLNIGLKEVLPTDFIKENPILARGVINAATAGINAAINDKDVGQAVLGAVVNTGVNAGAGALAGDMGLNEQQTKAVTSLITPIITSLVNTGRVSDQTILNAVMTAVGTAVKSGVTNPESANKPVAPTGTTGGTTSSVLFGGTDDPFFAAYSNAISAGMTSEEAAEAAGAIVNQPITTRVNDAFNQTLKETGDKNLALDAASQAGGVAVSQPVTGGTSVTGTDIGRQEDQGDWAGLAVAQDQATLRNTVNVANDQADTPQEALALVQSQNPTADSFTFGGQTYKILASNEQIGAQITANDIANASTFNEAYRLARDSLGPNKTFTWQGKEYSTATFAERPDLAGTSVVPGATSDTAGAGRGSYAGFDTAAAVDAAGRPVTGAQTTPNVESTGIWNTFKNFISTQMNLSSDAANEYLRNNPDSPFTKSVSTAFEAAGELQKNIGGGIALALDNKPVANAFTQGGDALIRLGQSIGSGPQDSKNWNDTVNLINNAKGLEKLAVVAGRIMDGTSGLGRQVEMELRQELPALFLGGGSVRGILVASGLIDTADTAGSAVIEAYDASVKSGKTHNEALSDARKAGAAAGAAEAVIQATIGKLGEVVVGKLDNIIAKGTGRVLGEGVTEGGQESGASAAVDVALGRDIDVNKMLTEGVVGAAVGKGTASTTSPVSTAQDVSEATGATVVDSGAQITTTFGNQISSGVPVREAVNTAINSAVTAEADVGATVESLITSGVTAGANTSDLIISTTESAINAGGDTAEVLNSVISAGINSGADASVVVGSTFEAAINAGTNPVLAASTTISAAVSSGANVNQVISTIQESITRSGSQVTVNTTQDGNVTTSVISDPTTGVQTTINIDGNTVTQTTINNNVTTETTQNASTQTTVVTDQNTNTQTTTNIDNNTGVQTQTTVNNNTGVTTNTAVDTNTNTTTQTTTDTNTNTQTTVTTNTNTNTQTTTVINTNTGEVIRETETTVPDNWTPPTITTEPPAGGGNPPPGGPVVTPTTPTITTTPKGGGGGGGGGPAPVVPPSVLMGGIGAPPPMQFGPGVTSPLDVPILKPEESKFYKEKKIDPIQRVLEAQSDFMNMPNIPQFQAPQQAAAPLAAMQAPAPAPQREEAPTKDFYSYGVEKDIDTILGAFGLKEAAEGGAIRMAEGGYVAPLMMKDGGDMPLPLMSKAGGALSQYGGRENFKEGKHVAGEGDGQSDDIPAWLADGEFVFPADVVSALGNGSTKAGTDKLYEMMHGIRERARSKGPKDLPPPALKSPLDYLKSRKGAR